MTTVTFMWVAGLFWVLGGLSFVIMLATKDIRFFGLMLIISMVVFLIVAYNLGLLGGHGIKIA